MNCKDADFQFIVQRSSFIIEIMRRPEKLAELIREEISQIVGFELEDPRVASVTVTDVRVTDNLRDARVFVLPEGTEAERVAALKALHHAAPYVRRQLGMVLNLKYTPEIHFIRDTVEEAAARVDDLLTQIAQEEKSQLSPEDTAGDPREETPQTRNDER